ncbi:MAG: hypothetical protein HZR80_09835 [Candidatus Heimdallarchaeota archaeon]
MFKKLSKFISYLILLGIQVAYNLFVILGLHIWDFSNPWISHRTTIILLALPTIIVFNVVSMIIVGISFFSLVKKEEEEKKGFKMPDKVTQWFKGEAKEEKDIEIPDKVTQWFKDLAKEEKDIKMPDKVTQWFKDLAKEEKE